MKEIVAPGWHLWCGGYQDIVEKGHLHPSPRSQTMNYVGQLAETVFVTVKELYRGLNPATLTGGIDVIVVRQPDGSLQCSPFHVRFGKLGVLRSKEKVVDIEINGEPVDLHMKLGDNGEAFFVEENESLEAEVPAHLCTSPIPMEAPDVSEVAESFSSTTSSLSTRRKKRRKKRMRSDAHLHEEVSSSSEERETPEQDAVKEESVFVASKSVYYSMSEEPDEDVRGSQAKDLHSYSDVEGSPDESLFYSRPSSPKSDSELWVKPQETSGPQLQWNWGGFPKVCPSERGSTEMLCSPPSLNKPSERSHFRTIQRQASFNVEPSDPMTVTILRPEPVFLERASHSTPNTDDISPTQQSPPLPLHHIKPALGSEQQNSLELEAQSCLNDSMANTVRTVNQDYRDNTTSTAYDDTLDSIINDFSRKVVISVGSENHASSVSLTNTDEAVSKPSLEAIATSVDKFSAFTQTAQLTTAEKQASLETGSTIEALTKGFAEQEEKVFQECEATVAADYDQKAKRVTFKSDQKPGFRPLFKEADSSSKTADSLSKTADSLSKTADSLSKTADSLSKTADSLSKTEDSSSKSAESYEKKKDKHSQHVEPAEIYLDDLSKLDPEVVALYFPKSEAQAPPHGDAELVSVQPIQSPQLGQQSPQSLSTANVDSGTEYLSDSTSDSLDISMSLCGTEGSSTKINKEKFEEHIVTYQDFANNPGIIDNPNLVICINSNYYNWAAAAPMILSMQVFQKNLPKSTVEQLVKAKMPKRSGRWWFSWRRKELENNQPNAKPDSEEQLQPDASSPLPIPPTTKIHSGQPSSDDDGTDSKRQAVEAMNTIQCLNQIYRKSLRLTSKQIEQLNLREGANKIVFSVTTQYQGTCRCEATIYLWNWDDKIIISDIDGTITKSDALGHILPQLGKDWTHHGIAKLYHKIHQNGYKFLYCSARAIGMANITKGYLQWVNDKGTVLPKGPVLLAPSSLFSALHREVIERKPEVFKIACLTDIRDLFNPHRQSFYAAFGNRTNDAFAYKEVGVPETRIFTVNPKGELIQENSKGHKSSYSHLSELVEHVFPLLSKGPSVSFDYPEFSNFSFWREPLPSLDLSAL
ncbi:Phosphatidate phosphatase LPIN2 [Bagarius yarrelli]|uniref:phosphatidate phosphatase n=1 Tax=Bagarius yarrelli TaxID=175774 RepID=A0A556VY06_BAGYA|nr:Phosphatidate phosphatase LPIN2 [Bagarius yarrelli]